MNLTWEGLLEEVSRLRGEVLKWTALSKTHSQAREQAEAKLAEVVRALHYDVGNGPQCRGCDQKPSDFGGRGHIVGCWVEAALNAAKGKPCSCHSGSVCGLACAQGRHHGGCAAAKGKP